MYAIMLILNGSSLKSIIDSLSKNSTKYRKTSLSVQLHL